MKKVLIITVGVLIFCHKNVLSQNKSDTLILSLDQCIEIMKGSNSNIKIAEKNLEQRESERKAAKGLYYPKVDVSATYTKMSEPISLDLTPIGDALSGLYKLSAGQTQLIGALSPLIPLAPQYQQLLTGAQTGLAAVEAGEWDKTLQKDRFGIVDASITIPIYTGGKIRAANRAANVYKDEAETKLKATQLSETVSLVQYYYGLQLLTEIADVRKSMVDAMALHLQNTEKLIKNGMASDMELIHAKVSYKEAESEYKKSINDLEQMQLKIKTLLNVKETIVPLDALSINYQLTDRNNYFNNAKKSNLSIEQIKQKKLLSEQGILKERSAFLPDIGIFGAYNVYNYQVSDLIPNWYVGVGLKLNIFDGFTKFNKLHAAKIQKEQIELYEDKIQDDIEIGITQIYNIMQQSIEKSAVADERLLLADEYVRVQEKAFNQGFSTSVELVDANMNKMKVKIEKLMAYYEFNIAKAKLIEVTGDLTIKF